MKRYSIRKEFRFDQETLDILQKNAGAVKEKMNESEYIRQLIRRDNVEIIGIDKSEFDLMKRKMAGCGNNLNQIAHHLNMDVYNSIDMMELKKAMSDVAEIKSYIANLYDLIWKKG